MFHIHKRCIPLSLYRSKSFVYLECFLVHSRTHVPCVAIMPKIYKNFQCSHEPDCISCMAHSCRKSFGDQLRLLVSWWNWGNKFDLQNDQNILRTMFEVRNIYRTSLLPKFHKLYLICYIEVSVWYLLTGRLHRRDLFHICHLINSIHGFHGGKNYLIIMRCTKTGATYAATFVWQLWMKRGGGSKGRRSSTRI